MPLFGKKKPDAEWRQSLLPLIDSVATTCEAFENAGAAVQKDPINGWATVHETLSTLSDYGALVKGAEQTFKMAGNPEGRNAMIMMAKTALDSFFGSAKLALHWGKYHYKDASSGPGQRARLESGFAQTAAIKRVSNNGMKFAENALYAAEAGRAAIEILSNDDYDAPSRPSLGNLFMEMARPGISKELLRPNDFPLSDVAMLGGWCYSRAAILGMVASSSEDPLPILVSVWKPEGIDTYWRLVQEEVDRLGVFSSGGIPGLAGLRGQTGYPELFSEDAISLALADTDAAMKLAQSRVSATEAHARWSMDSAVGLGVGLRTPEFISECLDADANPNRQTWEEAHQAGLDIPRQPDAVSASEQIEEVVDNCRRFFQQHYPDAVRVLDDGVAALRTGNG